MSNRSKNLVYKKDEQKAKELELLANIKVCKSNSPISLAQLNAHVLEAKLSKDFYSYSLIEALQCYFEITLRDKTAAHLPKANPELLKELRNPRRIGAESVEGVALLTGIDDVKDLVVIKAPRNPANDGLVHEYFVAKVALNKLRRFNPGYMVAFAAFECSAPVIQDRKVVEWCTAKGEQVNYVVFEKIPGPALEDVCQAATNKATNKKYSLNLLQYLSYIIQDIYGAIKALELYGWCHYDKHSGNVLLREIEGVKTGKITENGPFYVPFVQNGDGAIIYVKSDRVSTVIDYGRGHILYQGVHYGFHDPKLEKEDGLFPNKARPLYDAFKLIGFSLFDMLNSKDSNMMTLLRQLMPLYQFFRPVKNQTEYIASLKRDRDSFFVLSPTIQPSETNSSLQDLLQHIEKVYSNEWEQLVFSDVDPDELIVTCGGLVSEKDEEGQTCPTTSEEISKLMKVGLTRRSEISVQSKSASELVREVSQSRRRLEDMKRSNSNTSQSVEFVNTKINNTRSRDAIRNNAEALREQLETDIEDEKSIIEEQYFEYQGIDLSDEQIFDTARENDPLVREIIDRVNDSGLLPLVVNLKKYTADVYVLARLQEELDEPFNIPRKFILRKEIVETVKRDAKSVIEYLDAVSPVSNRVEVLKDGLRDELSTEIRDYDTEEQI